MAVQVIKEPNPKSGTFGKAELFALALGQVIGAGVVTLIVPAMKMTGYSAWLAYLIAIFLGFLLISPWLFVSSTVRMGGGNYSMLGDFIGPTASGIFAFMYLAQLMCLALFCTSAAAYLGDLIPALSGSLTRRFVGIILLTFFLFINLKGMDLMANIQKLMVWILIAALVIFAAVGIFHLELPVFDFGDSQFLTNGWGIVFQDGKISGGFSGAILLLVYSTWGYYMVSGYGKDAKNAKKDIPIAMLLCIPALIICYVGVAIAAAGSMTLDDYGTSTTLVFAAQKLMPTWLFYVFIIGGPIMALMSSLNSTMSYSAVMVGSSCDDGWFPKSLGVVNKHGARTRILILMYVVNAVPMLMGWSVVTLSNFIQLVMSAYSVLNFFAFIKMPKKYPEAWKKSKFHIPDPVFYGLCIISLLIACVIIWKSLLSMSTPISVATAVYLILSVILGIWRTKKGNIEIHTSVWDDDVE